MWVRMLMDQMAMEEQSHTATWPWVASVIHRGLKTAQGKAGSCGGTASSPAQLPGLRTGQGEKVCHTLHRWSKNLKQRRDSWQGKPGDAGIKVALGLMCNKDHFLNPVCHWEQKMELPVQLLVQLGGRCSDGAGALCAALGFGRTWVGQETQFPAWPVCVWVTEQCLPVSDLSVGLPVESKASVLCSFQGSASHSQKTYLHNPLHF